MERMENYSDKKTETSQNIPSSHVESERRKASAGSRYSSVLNDDIPSSGSRIQRNRNTFPKARQREGPPAPDIFSAGAPTKTGSGENIQSQVFFSRRRGRRREQSDRSEYGSRGRGRASYSSTGELSRNSESYGRYRGGPGASTASREGSLRAPSERKINSLQRKKKRSYPLTEQDRRARSETRNISSSAIMTSSLTSSGSLWRPDGKCPSFADILKGGAGVEEVGENNVLPEPQGESVANNIKSSETYHIKANEGKEDDSQSFFSNTNVSRTEEVISADYNKSFKEEKLPETNSDDLAKYTECDENQANDNISISTQNNSLSTFKSYANILSGGIKKVSNVFKTKSREMLPKEKIQEPASVAYSPSFSTEMKEEQTENFKPEIPGLLFKDLERRPSKKKRKSRPNSSFHEPEQNIDKSVLITEEESAKNPESQEANSKTESEGRSERIKDISKENTLKRKNSKKKKSFPQEEIKHFADEIDKALHEIKLIEEQEKYRDHNQGSLKRRTSRKFRNKNRIEVEDHEDHKNAADNQVVVTAVKETFEQVPSISNDVMKTENGESSQETCGLSFDIPDDEEIECLREDDIIEPRVKISTSLHSLVHCEKGLGRKSVMETSECEKPSVIGLPMTEASEAWMDDDNGDTVGLIESEEEDTRTEAESEIQSSSISSKKSMSAMDEALRFSCDNDETTENGYEIIKDASVCENVESTSWAFVASKESTQKISNPALPSSKKVSASNPALIVEIIEKEKVEDQVDEDGYKVVVKTKQKQKEYKRSKESSTFEAIINELDQPIEDSKSQADDITSISDDFVNIETNETDQENTNENRTPKTVVKNSDACEAVTDELGDPWEAVKEEYVRKDSKSILEEEQTSYTLDVKVVTRETCLGRKLHEKNDESDWRMDVQCVQRDVIPDIIEGQNRVQDVSERTEFKSSTLPRTLRPASNADNLQLSPSWMRKKDFTRTRSVESIRDNDAAFKSVKERKTSESKSSVVTSSAETLEETTEDIYWRLKHKGRSQTGIFLKCPNRSIFSFF